jgi:hypothetical protein
VNGGGVEYREMTWMLIEARKRWEGRLELGTASSHLRMYIVRSLSSYGVLKAF